MDNYSDFDENSHLYKTMRSFRGKREGRIMLSVGAMLVFFGLVLGVVLYRLTGDDIPFDTDGLIDRYFGGMFSQANSLNGKIGVILSSFLHEITLPSLTFIFGYTVFSPIFSSALCIWKATLCAYAICMLEFTAVSGIFVESLLFLIAQIAIISVDVSVAMRSYVYSTKFNSDKVSLKDVVKRSDSLSYICDFIISAGILFISIAGTLIVINFIR